VSSSHVPHITHVQHARAEAGELLLDMLFTGKMPSLCMLPCNVTLMLICYLLHNIIACWRPSLPPATEQHAFRCEADTQQLTVSSGRLVFVRVFAIL